MVKASKTIFAIVAGTIAQLSNADTISCPILQCNEPYLGNTDTEIEKDMCWTVEENQPMEVMRSHECSWYTE